MGFGAHNIKQVVTNEHDNLQLHVQITTLVQS